MGSQNQKEFCPWGCGCETKWLRILNPKLNYHNCDDGRSDNGNEENGHKVECYYCPRCKNGVKNTFILIGDSQQQQQPSSVDTNLNLRLNSKLSKCQGRGDIEMDNTTRCGDDSEEEGDEEY
eukprot:TRINITY_DN4863_c0_g1_i1.p1 TRINITY_DN4863_c0_g1~~TRINITY_DN4863_c0_g1_i1.p1  ORF type:complete len:122 (-),score=19.75 TRINITY_DN4863_c0_g1_i1:56-421(-)